MADCNAQPAPDLILAEEIPTFWMVWTKKGHKPRYMHSTFEAASAEADRLAHLTPGAKFIVLQAVRKVHAISAAPVQ